MKRYRLAVVSTGAKHLVMGFLMRRNILAYKAPPGNDGYDLICIRPDPRHRPGPTVLIVAFLNIGKFMGSYDGSTGEAEREFYTLPTAFVRQHHDATSTWQKVKLRKLAKEIEPFKNYLGFEQIAQTLGVGRPRKLPRAEVVDVEE